METRLFHTFDSNQRRSGSYPETHVRKATAFLEIGGGADGLAKDAELKVHSHQLLRINGGYGKYEPPTWLYPDFRAEYLATRQNCLGPFFQFLEKPKNWRLLF
jgi:hypothetical protein